MSGDWSEDDSFGIDLRESFNPCYEKFDIIVLPGAWESGERESTQGVIVTKSPKKLRSKGANRNRYTRIQRQEQPELPHRQLSLCKVREGREQSVPPSKDKSPIINTRNQSARHSPERLPRLTASLSWCPGQSLAHQESHSVHKGKSATQGAFVVVSKSLSNLVTSEDKPACASNFKSREATTVEEDCQWFSCLLPDSDVWRFEVSDTALRGALKLKVESPDESLIMDSIMVSYEPEENTNKLEGSGESLLEDTSPPYDPLYECAFEFARTHGYGFVKFVDTEKITTSGRNNTSSNRSRLRKSRSHLHHYFKGAPKIACSTATGRRRRDTPAWVSRIKLGAVTGRGLCGGRPHHPELFCRRLGLDYLARDIKRDVKEESFLTRFLREKLLYETYSDKTAFKNDSCEEETGRQRHTRRVTKSVSPKRTRPNNSIHSHRDLPTSGTAPSHHKSLPVASYPTPLQCQETHFQHGRGYQKNNASMQVTKSKDLERNVNQRVSYFPPKYETEDLDEEFNLWQVSQPAPLYRQIMREKCERIASGVLPVRPNDNPSNSVKIFVEPTNNSREVYNQELLVAASSENNKTVECRDGAYSENEISFTSVVDGSDALATDSKIITAPLGMADIAKGKFTHKSKTYRLFNSLSATIFRESQRLSSSASSRTSEPTNLESTPVEVVHIKTFGKDESASHKAFGGARPKELFMLSSDDYHCPYEAHLRCSSPRKASNGLSAEDADRSQEIRLSPDGVLRCVRNRRYVKTKEPGFYPTLSSAYSSHLFGSSSKRTGSCPNLASHKHRRNKTSNQTKSKNMSPRRSLRPVGDSPLHYTQGQPPPFMDLVSSATGDCTSTCKAAQGQTHRNHFQLHHFSPPCKFSEYRPNSPRRRTSNSAKKFLMEASPSTRDLPHNASIRILPLAKQCASNVKLAKEGTLLKDEPNRSNVRPREASPYEEDYNNNSGNSPKREKEFLDLVSPTIPCHISHDNLTQPRRRRGYIERFLPNGITSHNNNALSASGEGDNVPTALPNLAAAPNARRQWAPAWEPPRYAECNCSDDDACRCQQLDPLTTHSDLLRLPALANPHNRMVTPEVNLERVSLPNAPGAQGSKNNAYQRREATIVGFGAAATSMQFRDEEEKTSCGNWEAQTQRKSQRSLIFPPAMPSNSLCQTRQKTQEKILTKTQRDHPLNRSYVISRDEGGVNTNVLRLPEATPERPIEATHTTNRVVSRERLELPPCVQVNDRERGHLIFQPRPNPSVNSPEFRHTRKNDREVSRVRTEVNICSDEDNSIFETRHTADHSNINNSALGNGKPDIILCESKLNTKHVNGFRSKLHIRNAILDTNCLKYRMQRVSFSARLYDLNDSVRKYIFMNLKKKDASSGLNISNNAHDNSADDSCQSIDAPTESELNALEQELSSLIHEQIYQQESYVPQESPIFEVADNANTSAQDECSFSQYGNTNNARSMNQVNARDAEFARRRRLQFRSPTAVWSSEVDPTDIDTLPNSQVNQCPMEVTANASTPYSPPSTQSGVWSNMLTQEPMSRHLWSCQQNPYQQQQQHHQSFPQTNEDVLRFGNDVPPYTTENYWQVASNPNAPLPRLNIFESSANISSPQGNHTLLEQQSTLSQPTPGQKPEGMEVSDPLNHSAEHMPPTSSNLSDLFSRLDDMWTRSQQHVNQKLEAISSSMHTKIKELQTVLEKHVSHLFNTQGDEDEDEDDDENERQRSLPNYSAISLDTKAQHKNALNHGIALDVTKTKKSSNDHLKADIHSNISKFPTISFQEVKGKGKGHTYRPPSFSSSQRTTERPQGSRAKRKSDKFSKYKSIKQWKHEVSKPTTKGCSLKQNSTRCSCLQHHSRRCRRRKGVDTVSCNLCVLAQAARKLKQPVAHKQKQQRLVFSAPRRNRKRAGTSARNKSKRNTKTTPRNHKRRINMPVRNQKKRKSTVWTRRKVEPRKTFASAHRQKKKKSAAYPKRTFRPNKTLSTKVIKFKANKRRTPTKRNVESKNRFTTLNKQQSELPLTQSKIKHTPHKAIAKRHKPRARTYATRRKDKDRATLKPTNRSWKYLKKPQRFFLNRSILKGALKKRRKRKAVLMPKRNSDKAQKRGISLKSEPALSVRGVAFASSKDMSTLTSRRKQRHMQSQRYRKVKKRRTSLQSSRRYKALVKQSRFKIVPIRSRYRSLPSRSKYRAVSSKSKYRAIVKAGHTACGSKVMVRRPKRRRQRNNAMKRRSKNSKQSRDRQKNKCRSNNCSTDYVFFQMQKTDEQILERTDNTVKELDKASKSDYFGPYNKSLERDSSNNNKRYQPIRYNRPPLSKSKRSNRSLPLKYKIDSLSSNLEKYKLTEKGWRSLISRLKLNCQRLRWMLEEHGSHTKVSFQYDKNVLLSMFKKVIAACPNQRLAGVWEILDKMVHSREKLEQENLPLKKVNSKIAAANHLWRVGEKSAESNQAFVSQQNQRLCTCQWPSKNLKQNINAFTFHTKDSSPKRPGYKCSSEIAHSYANYPKESTMSPSQRLIRLPTKDNHRKQNANRRKSNPTKGRKPRRVDSLELNRRRLERNLEDKSFNACLGNRIVADQFTYETAPQSNITILQYGSASSSSPKELEHAQDVSIWRRSQTTLPETFVFPCSRLQPEVKHSEPGQNTTRSHDDYSACRCHCCNRNYFCEPQLYSRLSSGCKSNFFEEGLPPTEKNTTDDMFHCFDTRLLEEYDRNNRVQFAARGKSQCAKSCKCVETRFGHRGYDRKGSKCMDQHMAPLCKCQNSILHEPSHGYYRGGSEGNSSHISEETGASLAYASTVDQRHMTSRALIPVIEASGCRVETDVSVRISDTGLNTSVKSTNYQSNTAIHSQPKIQNPQNMAGKEHIGAEPKGTYGAVAISQNNDAVDTISKTSLREAALDSSYSHKREASKHVSAPESNRLAEDSAEREIHIQREDENYSYDSNNNLATSPLLRLPTLTLRYRPIKNMKCLDERKNEDSHISIEASLENRTHANASHLNCATESSCKPLGKSDSNNQNNLSDSSKSSASDLNAGNTLLLKKIVPYTTKSILKGTASHSMNIPNITAGPVTQENINTYSTAKAVIELKAAAKEGSSMMCDATSLDTTKSKSKMGVASHFTVSNRTCSGMFSADGVPQHPYLEVNTPGLSTTWVSVLPGQSTQHLPSSATGSLTFQNACNTYCERLKLMDTYAISDETMVINTVEEPGDNFLDGQLGNKNMSYMVATGQSHVIDPLVGISYDNEPFTKNNNAAFLVHAEKAMDGLYAPLEEESCSNIRPLKPSQNNLCLSHTTTTDIPNSPIGKCNMRADVVLSSESLQTNSHSSDSKLFPPNQALVTSSSSKTNKTYCDSSPARGNNNNASSAGSRFRNSKNHRNTTAQKTADNQQNPSISGQSEPHAQQGQEPRIFLPQGHVRESTNPLLIPSSWTNYSMPQITNNQNMARQPETSVATSRPINFGSSGNSLGFVGKNTALKGVGFWTTPSLGRPLPSLQLPPPCVNATEVTGKRKRPQVNYLSESMAPPRKVPRMELYTKPQQVCRRSRNVQRRSRWQCRREFQFLAAHQRERMMLHLRREQTFCDLHHPMQAMLNWRHHQSNNNRASDADCESD